MPFFVKWVFSLTAEPSFGPDLKSNFELPLNKTRRKKLSDFSPPHKSLMAFLAGSRLNLWATISQTQLRMCEAKLESWSVLFNGLSIWQSRSGRSIWQSSSSESIWQSSSSESIWQSSSSVSMYLTPVHYIDGSTFYPLIENIVIYFCRYE